MKKNSKSQLSSLLREHLPKRLVDGLSRDHEIIKRIADYKAKELEEMAQLLHNYVVKIDGTEGYKKAEVLRTPQNIISKESIINFV